MESGILKKHCMRQDYHDQKAVTYAAARALGPGVFTTSSGKKIYVNPGYQLVDVDYARIVRDFVPREKLNECIACGYTKVRYEYDYCELEGTSDYNREREAVRRERESISFNIDLIY